VSRIAGGKSAAFFQHGTQALVDMLPKAKRVLLEDQSLPLITA